MTLPDPPRAVLLDLDGTLIDGSGMGAATLVAAGRVADQHDGVDAVALAARVGTRWDEAWVELERDWVLGRIGDIDLATPAWERALADLGIADPDAAPLAAAIHLDGLQSAFPPYPDALATLDSLASAGVPLGIVSNGTTTAQRAKVELLGPSRFAVVAISSEVGAPKPDPAIFDFALAELGVAAADAVHVGDSVRADVAGGRAAGVPVVWIDRGDPAPPDEPVEAAARIHSLTELFALLRLG